MIFEELDFAKSLSDKDKAKAKFLNNYSLLSNTRFKVKKSKRFDKVIVTKSGAFDTFVFDKEFNPFAIEVEVLDDEDIAWLKIEHILEIVDKPRKYLMGYEYILNFDRDIILIIKDNIYYRSYAMYDTHIINIEEFHYGIKDFIKLTLKYDEFSETEIVYLDKDFNLVDKETKDSIAILDTLKTINEG